MAYEQGETGTLTVTWLDPDDGTAVDVTGQTITITPAAGGAAIIGPTAVGITNPATGVYVYAWAVAGDLDVGDYVVTWSATDGLGAPRVATEVVTVTAAGTGTLYATLGELKGDRRVTKTQDDALLLQKLTAASRAIDRKTGRHFWLDPAPTVREYNPRTRVVSEPDGERLLVDDIGSETGMVVEVGSGSSWTAVTDYETEPGNAIAKGEPVRSLLRLSGCWGTYGSAQRVRVTAQHGWPAVPDDIKEATLLLANRLVLRKDSPEGVAASGEWGALRVSRWDPDVESLVGPFELPGLG